ncbi:hypothetical protein HELRODRAFT_68856 [Helobdella robusta]|uniref:Arginase n=1 Tax=Helobdella robusta TaxID=6412 RepID=T1FZK4_HELRO|nr:hypothetical protein HELRODRAFT_68856 [Helobdella robusta]ESN94633.1 hypothetical protein HELRODRAFT_68856 [Helobdella robusta]
MHFDVNGTKDDRVSNVKRAKSVGKANEQIAKVVEQSISQNHFCVALGGDHSIAIGTIIGHARAHPNLAVVWIDAHADLNPPLASPSGNSHGMPVSFLLRELVEYIPKDLPGFEWAKPCLGVKDIVYIGLRDLDEAEKALIEKHNILAFTMREVTELGVDAVVRAAIKYISPSGTRPIHLSFDIDGLDPTDAASTGTPVPGGLLLREGVYITESLAATGHLQMIDMVEVNPTLGSSKEQVRTLQSACEIIGACFGKRNRKLMSPGYIIPKP